MEQVWPLDRVRLDSIRAGLAAGFEPKEEACLAFVQERFALRDPERPVPVFLVARSPRPHAVTDVRHDGTGVCFVGIEDAAPPSLIFESVLHETIHALDVASPISVLSQLRDSLRGGPSPSDRRMVRTAVHTLLFIQAAATVRRFIDPGHEDYGVTRGYYAKFQPIADLEIPIWRAYAALEISRDEAVRRVVAVCRGVRNAGK
jgi:hypothetical protein